MSTCAPCHASSLLRSYATGEVTITSAVDLTTHGISQYARQLSCSVRDAIVAALDAGYLPSRLREEIDLLVELASLEDVSNSQAARHLGITRFTVASWRHHLGLSNPQAAHGRRASIA